MLIRATEAVRREWFLEGGRLPNAGRTYVSLFSGGGVGDVGFHRAGWRCLAGCEADSIRQAVFRANIPGAPCFSDIREDLPRLIEACRSVADIDLVVATPPCQSFSTANSRRGKMADPDKAAEDERNSLFFYAISAINQLMPRVAIFENVPNFFERQLYDPRSGVAGKVGDFLRAYLSNYVGCHDVQCMSAYGVNQRRRRASAVYVRQDIAKSPSEIMRGEASLLPRAWEGVGPSMALYAGEALAGFRPLDSRCEDAAKDPCDPLHSVPTYDDVRYRWIAEIPPGSGRSAYENDRCPHCGRAEVPLGRAHCHACQGPMTNRPYVELPGGGIRLVKGFKTSYRRMSPTDYASTVTTASSHFGSDIRLHPTQNRVLSARECAHLQTVPLDFDWSPLLARVRPKPYAIRQIIGEAVPSWFSFQLACRIGEYLS